MPWNTIQPWKRRQPTHASTWMGLKHIMVSATGRHRKTSGVWFHLQSEPGRDGGRTVTARPAWRGWGATVHQAQRFNPGRGESSGDGWWVCCKATWAYVMPANATHRNTEVINFRLYTLDYNKKGTLKTEHSVRGRLASAWHTRMCLHIRTGTYLSYFSINHTCLITIAASCEESDDKETAASTLPFSVYPWYVQTYVKIWIKLFSKLQMPYYPDFF